MENYGRTTAKRDNEPIFTAKWLDARRYHLKVETGQPQGLR
jgi:hypothetical protein